MRFVYFIPLSLILSLTLVLVGRAQSAFEIDSKVILVKYSNSNSNTRQGNPSVGLFCSVHRYEISACNSPMFQRVRNFGTENGDQDIITYYNKAGYKLVNYSMVDANTSVIALEKADSYREKELYKIIYDINTRVDSCAKRYVDSALLQINNNVLNWLKNIPEDVLSKEFKNNLKNQFMSEIDDKIKKAVDACMNEIRKTAVIQPQTHSKTL